MDTDPKRILEEMFPLLKGIKLRTHKFGSKPCSALVHAPVGDSSDSCGEFEICWEDIQQGLTVRVGQREDGHLIAEVHCTNASLPDRAAVSVGLVGTGEDSSMRKTILLDAAEKSDRRGSADFGLMADAVKILGPQLGIIVFLVL